MSRALERKQLLGLRCLEPDRELSVAGQAQPQAGTMMEVEEGNFRWVGHRKSGEQRFWISVGGNQGFLLVTGASVI